MAIAITSGICAGSFAPTSLFGIITYQVAQRAGIDVSTFVLLAVSAAANLVLLAVAVMMFPNVPAAEAALKSRPTSDTASKSRPTSEGSTEAALKSRPTTEVTLESRATSEAGAAPRSVGAAAATSSQTPMTPHQLATVLCLVGLVPGIIVSSLAGLEVDIGVLLISLGALLALLDPALGARAFARIDWSTAFVVGGIVTYVGVLQKLDAVNLLGREAMSIGTPIVAGVLICMIAGLVSAFASTTGVLAALVPMAVPLSLSGAVPGWALITTLGVSATIVDGSPYSNTGATLIASAPEEDRPRLRVILMRWSMAMVIVGPIVLLPLLVLLGR
jgi:di/tricarboxylate transporter